MGKGMIVTKAKPNAKVLPFPKGKKPRPRAESSTPATVQPLRPKSQAANAQSPGPKAQGLPSFALFGRAIAAGQTEEAGGMLMAMLGLDAATAVHAAEHLHQRYHDDPAIMATAQQLRHDLSENRVNDALMKIHACFGLQGLAALQMLAGFNRWLSS